MKKTNSKNICRFISGYFSAGFLGLSLFLFLLFGQVANANELIDVFQFNSVTNWNSTILNKSLSYNSYRVFLNNTNTVITGNGTILAMSGGQNNMDASTGNVYNAKVSNNGFSFSFYSKPESYGCSNSFYIELGDTDNLIRLDFDVANDNISLNSQGGGNAVKQFSSSCDSSNYHFYVVNIESDLINIYKDGVLFYVITPNINIDFSDYYFNQFTLNGTSSWNEVYVNFTDFGFFDFLLSNTQITAIYNSGSSVKNYVFSLPPCTSYNYSDWGACNTDTNRKYRTILSSVPASCDYTNPLSVAPVLGSDCVEIYDAQTVENLYFRFDTIENKCRLDMSCRISYNFDTSIFGSQSTGKVYYYPTSTSTAQYLGQIDLNTQKDLGVYGAGNLIATSTASSTNYSYYQIVPHSDIFDQDYATSTALVWFYDATTYKQIVDDVWNANNAANYLGIDTKSLACTDEQWASTSSIPFIGVNVDLLMCNTRKWLLDVGIQPMLNVQQKLFSLKEKIMTMFPMSLITSIQSSWKNSTDLLQSYLIVKPCYAADFSTTTAAYTGDFSMDIPDLFGDKSGTTTISLLSKNNLESLLGVDGFNWFNIVCRILIWAAFLGYCWWLITERLHIEILKH